METRNYLDGLRREKWRKACSHGGSESHHSQARSYPIFAGQSTEFNYYRHLLSHTSGIASLESEHIMEYYRAIGNDKATLIPRYFMTDDPEIKENAFEEIKDIMGSLVCL